MDLSNLIKQAESLRCPEVVVWLQEIERQDGRLHTLMAASARVPRRSVQSAVTMLPDGVVRYELEARPEHGTPSTVTGTDRSISGALCKAEIALREHAKKQRDDSVAHFESLSNALGAVGVPS